jgi:hypothetical protein
MNLELIAAIATPLTIILVSLIGSFVILSITRRDGATRLNLGPLGFTSERISDSNSEYYDEDGRGSDLGGYVFFDINDDLKETYQDVFVGFSEYTKIKGYKVSVSLDTSVPGKLGLKITIDDHGVTVSAQRVRNDVNEYISRIRTGNDDIDGLPMIIDPIEHDRLVGALKMRFSLIRHELEVKAATLEVYRNLIKNMNSTSAVTHAPTVSLNINQEGIRNMNETRKAIQSPGAVLGDRSSATISHSTINIGSTVSEIKSHMAEIDELIQCIPTSGLNESDSVKLARYLENAKEEMDRNSAEKGAVETWLERARGLIEIAHKSSELVKKALSFFASIGLAFSV